MSLWPQFIKFATALLAIFNILINLGFPLCVRPTTKKDVCATK